MARLFAKKNVNEDAGGYNHIKIAFGKIRLINPNT